MMLKKITIFCTFMTCSLIALSQQEAHFANLAYNPYILNPAAGGIGDILQIETTSRFQWLGYNGGPRSIMVTGNSPIKVGGGSNVLQEFNVHDELLFESPEASTGKTKHIVGGKFMNDAIGPFSKTSIYGSYAIHMAFSKTVNFGAGLGVGWSNFGINQDRVVLYNEADDTYSGFLGNSTSQNFLDANAGIVFYNSNFVAGVSMMQAFNNRAKFDDVVTNSNFNRHYFLISRYRFDTRGDFSYEPSIVAKLVANSPMSFNIGTRIIYRKSAWAGLQYRTSNAILFQLGSNIIKNLYVNYAYELSVGKIRTASNGTHEIQLGIFIGNNRNIDKEIKENKSSQP